MNILIIGSKKDGYPDEYFSTILNKIGNIISSNSHSLIICSCHQSSADYFALKGFCKNFKDTYSNIIVHRPDDKLLKVQWKQLEYELNIEYELNPEKIRYTSHGGVKISDDKSRSLAFLLCQLKAIDECDLIIFIGGRLNGSASLVASIALYKNIPIIPFRFFDGIGEYLFSRKEGDLKAKYGNDLVEQLSDPEKLEYSLPRLIEGSKGVKNENDFRIFLSYSWRRPELADVVEAIIRRRTTVSVFRDERDIKQGEKIDEIVECEIKEKCHIFISLWCIEYIESPYCYDEIMMWLTHRRKEDLFLLRFDSTRPVWPELRQEKNNRLEFNALWPNVGESREKLELALNKIIEDKLRVLSVCTS